RSSNLVAPEADDQVTGDEAGLVGRQARLDAGDQRAERAVVRLRDPDAEKRRRADVDGGRRLPGLDLLGDRERAVDRDREALARGAGELEAERGGRVDADHTAVPVEERAAGVARLKRGARPDHAGEALGAALAVADGERLAEPGHGAGHDAR